MQVYYYKVLGRFQPFVIPGEGPVAAKLPGDILEVGEQGHAYLQNRELFPYADQVILIGATFLGERTETPPAQEPAQEENASVVEELLSPPEETPPAEVPAADTLPPLPEPGAKTADVLAYLKQLEAHGYTPAQLEEVKGRFKSAKVLQEVERLRQKFVEDSLTIEG